MFDFGEFPILRTERLVLRPLRESDADALFAFWSDVEVQRYNAEPLKELSQASGLIAEWQTDYDANRMIPWGVALAESDLVVGMFSVYGWNRHHRKAEAGYSLAKAYWGRGLASEGFRAICGFGFGEMNLHRIECNTIADNHASVRMLERLGFKREGTRRESSWEDDAAFHDSAIYGLLSSEFR